MFSQNDLTDDESVKDGLFNTRRRFLGTLGGLMAGAILLPGEVEAAPKPLTPEQKAMWNRYIAAYAQFLQRQRFRNITVRQIIEAHLKSRGNVRNTPPPKSLWKNIVPTLRVADRLAGELRAPLVEIVSAYRSPAYNALCAGARRDSMHKHNLALDLKYATSPRNVAQMADRMRDRGYFRGGIGRYGSFTHIDTRGENADWRG